VCVDIRTLTEGISGTFPLLDSCGAVDWKERNYRHSSRVEFVGKKKASSDRRSRLLTCFAGLCFTSSHAEPRRACANWTKSKNNIGPTKQQHRQLYLKKKAILVETSNNVKELFRTVHLEIMADPASHSNNNGGGGGTGNDQQQPRKEIYTYAAPWTVYAMAWANR